MKQINLKNALIAGLIVYFLGITFFIGSYCFTILKDPELQSNIAIAIVIIPASILGAKFYYRKNSKTNGLKLGLIMFTIAGLLDALITVPVFFIPEGDTHLEFFTNPWFWWVGFEYVLSVFIYSRFRNTKGKSIQILKNIML